MRRYSWALCLLLPLLLMVGCGAKPRVDIYMEPVAADDAYELDKANGWIEIEKQDVRVRVRALDAADLLALSEDDDWNPYVRVSTWGRVTPLFTVFEVVVENQRESRVHVGPTALLIDANGAQYSSLPYDFFKDTYDTQTYERTEVYQSYVPGYGGYSPGYLPGYGGYRWRGRSYQPLYYTPYWNYYPRPRSYYIRRTTNSEAPLRRLTARETLFQGAKLFPGAHRSGLVVFERLDEGASDVRLIVPDVVVYPDRGRQRGKRGKRVEFAFDFRQIVTVGK